MNWIRRWLTLPIINFCLSKGFQFNSHEKRKETRDETRLYRCLYDMWLQLTWPVLFMEMCMETGTGSLWLQSQALLTWINLLFMHGNCNVVLKSLGSRIIFFRIFSSNAVSRYKRTEIIIRIIAYFYQEIFTKRSLSQYYWTFFLFISEKLV